MVNKKLHKNKKSIDKYVFVRYHVHRNKKKGGEQHEQQKHF